VRLLPERPTLAERVLVGSLLAVVLLVPIDLAVRLV
jgi:hypothetical protein